MKIILQIVSLIIFVNSNLFADQPHLKKLDPWDIALDISIHGKKGWTSCEAFANELFKKMTDNNTEAHLIIYRSENDEKITQKCAVVVYRDAMGKLWAMDQQMQTPRWIKGTCAEEWIICISPQTTNKVISCVPNSNKSNKRPTAQEPFYTK